MLSPMPGSTLVSNSSPYVPGGNDYVDDALKIVRNNSAHELFTSNLKNLLQVRLQSCHATSPLIFILLLPRHITSPEVTKQLRKINKTLKAIITTARDQSHGKLNVTWVDTTAISTKQHFRDDQIHLSPKGEEALKYALFTVIEKHLFSSI